MSDNERELRNKLKDAITEACEHYCRMIDFVDSPIGLNYSTESDGVSIKIDASVWDDVEDNKGGD